MHGVLSRARLVRSRIQTGAPASWVVLVLSQLRNQLVHRPAAPVLKTVFPSRDCFDLRVAAGILAKSSDERKSGEAFPQSRLVSQTKQSHLTWCIGLQTRALIRCSRGRGGRPGVAAVDSYEHNCDGGISNTATSLSRILPPRGLSAQHPPQPDRIPVRVGHMLP